MNISFSYEHLFPAENRAGRHIETLVRRFQERGHTVSVVTTACDEPIDPEGVEILRLRESPGAKGHGRSDTLLGKAITKFLKSQDVDVHFCEGLTPLSAVTVKAAERAGAKTVIRVLADATGVVLGIGGDRKLTPSALKKRVSTMLRYANVAAASSERCAELLADYYDGSTRVIEKCVDLAVCNPERVQATDIEMLREKFEIGERPALVYAREELRAETISGTIPLMQKLKAARPELVFLVAGRIEGDEDLEQEIADAGLEDSYRLLGDLSQRDLFAAYATSTFYLAPHDSRASESELLEAMAMKCPIACYGEKAETARQLIEQSGALVLPEDDDEQAATALLAVMDDAQRVQVMRTSARELAASKDIEKGINEVQHLFEELLEIELTDFSKPLAKPVKAAAPKRAPVVEADDEDDDDDDEDENDDDDSDDSDDDESADDASLNSDSDDEEGRDDSRETSQSESDDDADDRKPRRARRRRRRRSEDDPRDAEPAEPQKAKAVPQRDDDDSDEGDDEDQASQSEEGSEEDGGRRRRRRRRRRRLRHDEEEGDGDGDGDGEPSDERADDDVEAPAGKSAEKGQSEEEFLAESSKRLRDLDPKLTLRDLLPFLRPPKQVYVMSMASANGQHRAGDAVFEAFKPVDQNLKVKQVNIAEYLNQSYDAAEIEALIDAEYRQGRRASAALLNAIDFEALESKESPVVIDDDQDEDAIQPDNGPEVHESSPKATVDQPIPDKIFSAKLRNLILDKRPHQVILTHYLPVHFIAALKREHDLRMRIAVVVTEYDLHPYWIAEGVDQYLASTEKVRYKLLRAGVPSSIIDVVGIPVHPRFDTEVDRERVRRELGIRANNPTIVMRPGGIGPTERILEVIEEISSVGYGFNLLVLAGRNDTLIKAVNSMKTGRGVNAKALGFVENIHEVMGVGDLLITRAVGHTVAEAYASGLPMLLLRPETKAEERTVDWFVERGVAIKAHDSLDLEWLLTDLLRQQGRGLREMRNRALGSGRPRSGAAALGVEKICRMLN